MEPKPISDAEKIASKLYDLVDRKEQYSILEEKNKARLMKTKSEKEQYFEKASQILTCLAITESTPLEFIEATKDGSKTTLGSATRKKGGWFRVDLVDDREFRVQEADLYNEKNYKLHDNKFKVSGKTNEIMNRRVKRESKRKAQEREDLTKSEASAARAAMIKNEIDNILEYSKHGFVDRSCLEKLVEKATKNFTYTKDGYTTVVSSNEASTASVLSLCAIGDVLRDKRKADELSALDAKRRKIGKKRGRTPNTTRGADGFEVADGLHVHDTENSAEVRKKEKEQLEKQIKATDQILTDWATLVRKKTLAASAKGIAVHDQQLWPILQPKGFLRTERQLFLKISVPNSGVLSKNESEQLKVLEENDVTYLKLLANVESAGKKLTSLRKKYDEEFLSSSEGSPSVEELSEDKEDGEDVDEI